MLTAPSPQPSVLMPPPFVGRPVHFFPCPVTSPGMTGPLAATICAVNPDGSVNLVAHRSDGFQFAAIDVQYLAPGGPRSQDRYCEPYTVELSHPRTPPGLGRAKTADEAAKVGLKQSVQPAKEPGGIPPLVQELARLFGADKIEVFELHGEPIARSGSMLEAMAQMRPEIEPVIITSGADCQKFLIQRRRHTAEIQFERGAVHEEGWEPGVQVEDLLRVIIAKLRADIGFPGPGARAENVACLVQSIAALEALTRRPANPATVHNTVPST